MYVCESESEKGRQGEGCAEASAFLDVNHPRKTQYKPHGDSFSLGRRALDGVLVIIDILIIISRRRMEGRVTRCDGDSNEDTGTD